MAILDFIHITPKGSLGGIDVQATLDEIYTDTLQTTQHPVEIGAEITDHSFKRPKEIRLQCGWSNSSFEALAGTVAALFSGEMSSQTYVQGIYSQLLALQETRIPIEIITSKRKYSNMLIISVVAHTEERTSNILSCTVTCREILIVSTSATTLPPKERQADPASTASTENAGTKQAVTGSPSPGGSVPIQ